MPDFEIARETMVDTQLRTSSITDRDLLAVMGTVPRELFVPAARRSVAYADISHDLAAGGRRMAPAAPFGRLVQLAEVAPNDVVLDIGCGTGYSAAVLAGLASAVVAIETDEALVEAADRNLAELEIGNVAVLKADLAQGVPSEAPFDVIVIEGCVEYVPDTLLKQLREGGRLVASIKGVRTGVANVFVKAAGKVTSRQEFDLNLPMLPQFTQPRAFAL